MSREQLIHIFEESACLTKRQMKDYVGGIMADEEAHAAEVHLTSCPFCSEATEGMLAYKSEDIENAFVIPGSDFIQEHYSQTNPHIHLNSITHAHSHAHRHIKTKKKALPVSVHIAIAAVLLLFLGVIWYFKQGNQLQMRKTIAALTFSDKTNSATLTQESLQKQAVQEAPSQQASAKPVKETMAETKIPSSDNSSNDIKPVIYAAEADTKKLETTSMQSANTSSEDMNLAAAPAVVADNSVNDEKTNRKAALMEAANTVTDDGDDEAVKKEDKKTFVPDKLEIGDELYKQQKFSKAIVAYNQAMKDENPEKRIEAALKAAQCYIDLGKNDKAKTILERLASEDGTQKKAAQKMLNKIK